MSWKINMFLSTWFLQSLVGFQTRHLLFITLFFLNMRMFELSLSDQSSKRRKRCSRVEWHDFFSGCSCFTLTNLWALNAHISLGPRRSKNKKCYSSKFPKNKKGILVQSVVLYYKQRWLPTCRPHENWKKKIQNAYSKQFINVIERTCDPPCKPTRTPDVSPASTDVAGARVQEYNTTVCTRVSRPVQTTPRRALNTITVVSHRLLSRQRSCLCRAYRTAAARSVVDTVIRVIS